MQTYATGQTKHTHTLIIQTARFNPIVVHWRPAQHNMDSLPPHKGRMKIS